MTIAIGLQLPVQSQTSLYVRPWELTAGPDEIRATALAAEAAGFDYVASCDHVAIPADLADAMSTGWYDTVATLAFVAAATERIRLLSHIYVPAYRHPLQVAKSFSTLDHLSKGRVVLGVGAGHVEAEFAALGIDFSKRGRLLDESIDALRAAFDDEFPTHHGSEWEFDGMGQRPRPAQTHLPIWVAGSSTPAMRRAAQRADGWLPQGTSLAELPAAYDYIRDERSKAGRDGPFTFGSLCGDLYIGDADFDLPKYAFAAAPEKLARFVRKFVAAGADQVQVRFPSRSIEELVDQIGRFGAEVAPLLEDV